MDRGQRSRCGRVSHQRLRARRPRALRPAPTSRAAAESSPTCSVLSGPTSINWIRHSLQAESYPSFTLLVWGPDGGRQIRWRLDEGLTCSRLPNDRWGMETSSFWRTDEVLAWRRDLFDRWLADGAPFEGRLPSFNLIEEPGRHEWSPFMSRSFSATRSITLVAVDQKRGRAKLMWWPRPADGPITPEPHGIGHAPRDCDRCSEVIDWLHSVLAELASSPLCRLWSPLSATFVLEDPTTIGAGLLVADGRMEFMVAFLGVSAGIAVGDMGLYGIGRLVGPRVIGRGPLHP